MWCELKCLFLIIYLFYLREWFNELERSHRKKQKPHLRNALFRCFLGPTIVNGLICLIYIVIKWVGYTTFTLQWSCLYQWIKLIPFPEPWFQLYWPSCWFSSKRTQLPSSRLVPPMSCHWRTRSIELPAPLEGIWWIGLFPMPTERQTMVGSVWDGCLSPSLLSHFWNRVLELINSLFHTSIPTRFS